MGEFIVTTSIVETQSAGSLKVHVFENDGSGAATDDVLLGTIVTVHPWSTLGGSEHNTVGLAKAIVRKSRWRVVTFQLMSRFAAYGILTSHSYEVQQITDVSLWASTTFGPKVVLLGSSAGAPFAGSAMSNLLDKKDLSIDLKAYIGVGYTFGRVASLAFGGHFSSVVGSNMKSKDTDCKQLPPRLFIMGENDEFTSVQQLKEKATEMRKYGETDISIVRGVGHFQLESPGHDPIVADIVIDWLGKLN